MMVQGTPWRMLLLTGAVVAVAACAGPSRWHKTDATAAERREDVTECRAGADARAEQRYARENPAHTVERSDGSSFDAMMDRNDAVLMRDDLFADCMRIRGYSSGGADQGK